jgi:hypothetical protein
MKHKFKFKIQVLGNAPRTFKPQVCGGRIGRVWNTVAVIGRMSVAESVRQKIAMDGALARASCRLRGIPAFTRSFQWSRHRGKSGCRVLRAVLLLSTWIDSWSFGNTQRLNGYSPAISLRSEGSSGLLPRFALEQLSFGNRNPARHRHSSEFPPSKANPHLALRPACDRHCSQLYSIRGPCTSGRTGSGNIGGRNIRKFLAQRVSLAASSTSHAATQGVSNRDWLVASSE